MSDLKIRIPLSNGRTLVAEPGGDPLFKEVFVGIECEDGDWLDLAVIGEYYTYDLDKDGHVAKIQPCPGEYAIKVFDPDNACDMKAKFFVSDKEALS